MSNSSKVAHQIEPVGLVGLGLMGRGIATCLLSRGLQVIAYDCTAKLAAKGLPHIEGAMKELARRKVVPREHLRGWKRRFRLAAAPAELAPCRFVIESIKEDLTLKRQVYDALELALSATAVIASNTSSLSITSLQTGRAQPRRFIGMHWGEPAEIMRYLEVIPGQHTSRRTVQLTMKLGAICGKQPTLLRQDIQGFLSNRMMYAMMREACYLVEAGIADIETVDRSFRNDIGWWATLAGPFRLMDLTGIPAYALVMEGLLPKLCAKTEVPRLMREMVASGATGLANARGFYRYNRTSAKAWHKAWVEFTYDVRELAAKYSAFT